MSIPTVEQHCTIMDKKKKIFYRVVCVKFLLIPLCTSLFTLTGYFSIATVSSICLLQKTFGAFKDNFMLIYLEKMKCVIIFHCYVRVFIFMLKIDNTNTNFTLLLYIIL